MNTLFQTSWSRAWQGLHAIGDGLAVRDAVLARYAEPHRKYHTLQHLEECLALFDSVRQAADRPAEVEVALWFHDAIYDLASSDNESRSAAWAREALRAAGVSEESAARVHDLVLKTRHTEIPDTRDERILVDIDLAILGAPPARFAEYERQIRDEYSYVPASVFGSKRVALLEGFLDRPSIYGTPELHRRFEAKARENLAATIARNATATDLPPLPVIPLGRYRHYKGDEYEVIGMARHSESLEPLVVYRPLYNASGLWVRPHAMFVGKVEIDGQLRPRFELMNKD